MKADGDVTHKVLGVGALGFLLLAGFVAITVPLLIAVLLVATFLPYGTYSTQPGIARVTVPVVIMFAGLILQPALKVFFALIFSPWKASQWPDRAMTVVNFLYDFLLIYIASDYLLETGRAALVASGIAFVLYAGVEYMMDHLWPEYFQSKGERAGHGVH